MESITDIKLVTTIAISLWLLIKLFSGKSEYNRKDNNVNY